MRRQRIFDLCLGAFVGVGLLGWWQTLGAGSQFSSQFSSLFSQVLASEPQSSPASGTQDSEGDAGPFLMATAKATTGGALLFLLNTQSRVLNVYEADGGTRATRGLTFVASRKIERDLYVTGYNDRSEYSYQDLVERFRLEETRAEALGESGAGTDDDR